LNAHEHRDQAINATKAFQVCLLLVLLLRLLPFLDERRELPLLH
jgi:hypothetical protein